MTNSGMYALLALAMQKQTPPTRRMYGEPELIGWIIELDPWQKQEVAK